MDVIDSESLLQRFVDQELSSEERVRLLVRLGRDSVMRERLIDLEQLLLEVGRLPRPVVRASFVSSVLARLETPVPSLWKRLTDVLWTPRTLQWNVASAAVLAALVLAVTGNLVTGGVLRRPAPGDTTAPTLIADAHPSAVLVRLVVVHPSARSVEAAGDFNGWNPARTPLAPAPNGAWTVTIPLQPGRYNYKFVVDGSQWIADPFAVEQIDDGFGAQNAVLEVRAPIETAL